MSRHLIAPVLVALLAAIANQPSRTLAHGIQPGHWVVTTADRAPVQASKDILFVLGKDTELRAERVNGDWIAVTVLQGGKKTRGWVQAKHLAVLAEKSRRSEPAQSALGSIPPEERFIAFSLGVARKKLESAASSQDSVGLAAALSSRQLSGQPDPEAFRLGGITRIRGLVVDSETADIIIVGQYIPGQASLTLDDLVVALRARFIHAEWPVVSIDPPSQPGGERIHTVRFEGSVENTPFGQTLFDADYLLKKLGLALVATGVPAVESHWALASDRAKKSDKKSLSVFNRFWFYPISPAIPVRENVAAFRELEVGVFRELLGVKIDGKPVADLSKFKDDAAEQFVVMLRDHYDELAAIHPPFRRLQQLNDLVALTCAVQAMEPKPDLSWWLDHYRIIEHRTPTSVAELSRQETYGSRYGRQGTHTMSGGVQLRALARRVKAGDVSALRDAALKTRPGPDALRWEFAAADWLVSLPSQSSPTTAAHITQRFMYALFLIRQKHREEALAELDGILRTDPEFVDAWFVKGELKRLERKFPEALKCFDEALARNPSFTDALVARGRALLGMRNPRGAIEHFDRALAINPKLASAIAFHGLCWSARGRFDEALADVHQALDLDPALALAYAVRAQIYRLQEKLDEALREANMALQIDPDLAGAYLERAMVYERQDQPDRAITDYTNVLSRDPSQVTAWYRRALLYDQQSQYEKAVRDYTEAISRAPEQAAAEAYFRRSEAYRKLGQLDKALADCSKVGLLLFVEATSENAPLKQGPKTVGTVVQGEELQVLRVNGDWLWVESISSSGEAVRGWIDQRHLR